MNWTSAGLSGQLALELSSRSKLVKVFHGVVYLQDLRTTSTESGKVYVPFDGKPVYGLNGTD